MSLPEPASSPQILRIPRTDEPDTHVLLYVSRFDATLVDLNIAATEGETPYTTTGTVQSSIILTDLLEFSFYCDSKSSNTLMHF